MARTIGQTVILTALECGDCGLAFGLTERFIAARRADGQTWYCPNGHARYYGPSEADKLRAELQKAREATAAVREREAHYAARLVEERRAHATTKGQLTRARKRANAGICQLCHRHFAQVERHMLMKHPAEAVDAGLRPPPTAPRQSP